MYMETFAILLLQIRRVVDLAMSNVLHILLSLSLSLLHALRNPAANPLFHGNE